MFIPRSRIKFEERNRTQVWLPEMKERRSKATGQEARSARTIRLRVVRRNPESCVIDAAADDTVAFRGDAIDAPTLCCGSCNAPLVVAVDRRRLTNMVIECKRCGSFNDTREHGAAPGTA
jgi:hypothetical protein